MGDDLKSSIHSVACSAGLAGLASYSFAFDSCKTWKHSVPWPTSGGVIVWCYSEVSAILYRQLAGTKHVRFHEELPADFNNIGENPCLIILYYLLNIAYSKDVCDLFTKSSYHRNISVILITQNLFHQGKFCRDISLYAKYIVVLKNVRYREQLHI